MGRSDGERFLDSKCQNRFPLKIRSDEVGVGKFWPVDTVAIDPVRDFNVRLDVIGWSIAYLRLVMSLTLTSVPFIFIGIYEQKVTNRVSLPLHWGECLRLVPLIVQ